MENNIKRKKSCFPFLRIIVAKGAGFTSQRSVPKDITFSTLLDMLQDENWKSEQNLPDTLCIRQV